jgi:hypothetical protein
MRRMGGLTAWLAASRFLWGSGRLLRRRLRSGWVELVLDIAQFAVEQKHLGLQLGSASVPVPTSLAFDLRHYCSITTQSDFSCASLRRGERLQKLKGVRGRT